MPEQHQSPTHRIWDTLFRLVLLYPLRFVSFCFCPSQDFGGWSLLLSQTHTHIHAFSLLQCGLIRKWYGVSSLVGWRNIPQTRIVSLFGWGGGLLWFCFSSVIRRDLSDLVQGTEDRKWFKRNGFRSGSATNYAIITRWGHDPCGIWDFFRNHNDFACTHTEHTCTYTHMHVPAVVLETMKRKHTMFSHTCIPLPKRGSGA